MVRTGTTCVHGIACTHGIAGIHGTVGTHGTVVYLKGEIFIESWFLFDNAVKLQKSQVQL